ncbi:MAG: histidinol dehydrogenase [Bacillota bacterium]
MEVINASNINFEKCEKSFDIDFETKKIVTDILSDISKNKEKALKKYTKKFDKVDLEKIRISGSKIKEAYKSMDKNFLEIIKEAKENIEKFHKNQVFKDFEYQTVNKSTLGQITTPIKRVGFYVPGGTASYPSSVLMNVIPAIIAGVKELVLISPPPISKEILACSYLLGIKEIYSIGGAQAIGAITFGTETIKPVDKIVGPGNKYVAEAKRQVFGQVDIDMIAGPSEILILADKDSNPKYIARDLLSQAEHDENAKCFLLTNSKKTIKDTKRYLKEFINKSKRKDIIEKAIEKLKIYKTENIKEMIKISNSIAPEHLEILLKNPKNYLEDIKNAGSIFIGPFSPEPVGDYFAGPNHTLPTSKTAKFFSPLGVYDFVKRSSYIEYSKKDLKANGKKIIEFANREKLFAHANSIKERLNGID